jgi:hypothetical protein
MPCFLKVRERGADFQKGVDAYKIKEYATALREWKPTAEQGYAGAHLASSRELNRGP